MNNIIYQKAEKVWHALFDPEKFKEWTSPFAEGSYFTGEMKQGGRVHFLMPDGSPGHHTGSDPEGVGGKLDKTSVTLLPGS